MPSSPKPPGPMMPKLTNVIEVPRWYLSLLLLCIGLLFGMLLYTNHVKNSRWLNEQRAWAKACMAYTNEYMAELDKVRREIHRPGPGDE